MFFKCKCCGNYSDEGDPLNFVCLKCIDRGFLKSPQDHFICDDEDYLFCDCDCSDFCSVYGNCCSCGNRFSMYCENCIYFEEEKQDT